MAKKAKRSRATAKRKAFLKASEQLAKYFDDDGLVKDEEFDSDQIADSIIALFYKLPENLQNLNSTVLLGSALYFLQNPADLRELDKCSESCRGAMPFEAAFLAGWSIGHKEGRDEAEGEIKGATT